MKRHHSTALATLLLCALALPGLARSADHLADGTFPGEARGHSGPIRVEVTVEAGKVKDVRVTGQRESRPYNSLTAVPDRIEKAGTTKGVDAISGATNTSNAIKGAVDDALEKSRALYGKKAGPADRPRETPASTPLPGKRLLGATHVTPVPVWVVATYNDDGTANAMTAAWVGIVASHPPQLAVSLRSATHTYGNIGKRKAFTLHVPSTAQMTQTDFFGLVSGKDVDKIAAAGMESVRATKVDAPLLPAFPVIVECELRKQVSLDSHMLFVGEVREVHADATLLDSTGRLDLADAKPLFFLPGSRAYHEIGPKRGDAFSVGKALLPKAQRQ